MLAHECIAKCRSAEKSCLLFQAVCFDISAGISLTGMLLLYPMTPSVKT